MAYETEVIAESASTTTPVPVSTEQPQENNQTEQTEKDEFGC